MELQEVRSTLYCLLTDVKVELNKHFTYGDWQRKEALTYVIEKLDKELLKRNKR